MINLVKNSFIINKFSEAVWLMKPDRLKTMSDFIVNRINDFDELYKSLNLVQLQEKPSSLIDIQYEGSTAILNIEGVMVPKCSYIDSICGYVSTLEINRAFDDLVDDSRVERIILYFDSPGGEATAIGEFAEVVYEARNEKEIITFTDTDMDSAAYWVGSAASKIVALPSADIGSIGVYMGIIKFKENSFSEVIFMQAGDNKLFGSPYTGISDKEKAYFQEKVDNTYSKFVSAVSKYRNVSEEDVKKTQGSYYNAADAPEWMYDVLANYNYLFN